MVGHQLPIPGTEPVPAELKRARHNLRRDHLRHSFTNLGNRIARLGDYTSQLSDQDCAVLERLLSRLEGEMPA